MHSTTLSIDQLRISHLNARKRPHTAAAITALEESITAEGLWHPVQVHPMRGSRQTEIYGVFAGGGRYTAIANLIRRGDLPGDYEVRVHVHDDLDDGKIVVGSLAENVVRTNMAEFEVYVGIARAHAMGESIEEIAHGLGHDPIEIMRWLRVGQLAKPVFEAFSNGQISLDQAKAYGATDDHQLQLAAFEALQPLPDWHKRPSDIRAWMKFNDRVSERELNFVGADAYTAAGGRLQLDLFAADDEMRRRVVDPVLLRQLVDARLAALKEEIRTRADRDLRFVAKPPQTEYDTDDVFLQIPQADADAGAIALPEGDIIAHIAIGEDGQPATTFWWSSRSAKYGTARDTPRPRSLRPAAARPAIEETAVEEEAPAAARLNGDMLEILRSMRRAILRAALVDAARNGTALASDWLVFSQLRLLLDPAATRYSVGASPPGMTVGAEISRAHIAAMPASKVWGAAISDLARRPMLANADMAEAFVAFIDEPAEIKELAAAVIAGLSLERALNDDSSIPAQEALAALAGLHGDAAIRTYWTPTADLLNRLPTEQRLAIAEPFVESAVFGPWSRLKPAEITRRVLDVVTGATARASMVRAALAERAATWVHPLLRFGPGASDDPPPGAAIEAAVPKLEREVAA